ncbi:sortase [Bacillus coahuilensis]|uniref:sortase n=1 Tax=Bacillus coahuilensis TaxID=408580 RepID=UPI0007506385|nr:sortase [Bacillus coahuilensis]
MVMINRVMKYAGILLLLSGVGLISYASFHLFIQQEEQNMALNEAKAQVFSAEKEVLGASTSTYSFEKGDIIGILVIPKLNRELPIIEGTDEEELEKGVGHYSSTKLPNQKIVSS